MSTRTLRRLGLALTTALLTLAAGCAINSTAAGPGDFWYIRHHKQVYYCPPQGSTCYETEIH